MNVGPYSWDEFKKRVEDFHGYAAPGVLIGGFMVEKAKAELPTGTLFEAVVESSKCLPDSVQLLTACSTGNQRLKIHNLGRYALSLFDKYTGKGFRVSLDLEKMKQWPEVHSWFLKLKPKKEQDSEELIRQIEVAGDGFCRLEPIVIRKRFIGARHMGSITVCPVCGEAYPSRDGQCCRGCQGEAPYTVETAIVMSKPGAVEVVPVEKSVGRIAAHDMTRIEPGQFKGPEFKAGQVIKPEDVERLQQIGRFHVAVEIEGQESDPDYVHENKAAEAFASRMAGPGIIYNLPPKEGKIDFRAEYEGLLCVDEKLLKAFNMVPQVMCAARRDASVVKAGVSVAGERAIPLFLPRKYFEQALEVLENGPIFEIKPFAKLKTGILVTGTEVFKGLIQDKFIPIISAKVMNYGCEVVKSIIAPDDKTAIADAVKAMLEAGVQLLVTTGGLSVDPDDVTRQALLEMGLERVVHGMPVLPGAMSLVGYLPGKHGPIPVLGVPAGALYCRTTFFDLVLPRILAGREFTREDAAIMGSGGFCLGCKTCAWPKCPFGK